MGFPFPIVLQEDPIPPSRCGPETAMKNGHAHQSPDDLLEEEAAQWIARLASGDATAEDKRQAQAWRNRSHTHKQAFQNAKELWLGMGEVRPPIAATDVLEQHSTVIGTQTRRRRWAVAAMLVLVTIGALFQTDRLALWFAEHRTSTGEQTSLTLDDGSIVHLNTRTALSVDYTSAVRRITLLSGEAQFQVTPDTARPFVVHAAKGYTQAIGTAFAVRDHGPRATVTLIEGVVDVAVDHPTPGTSSQVRLHSGEQVNYDTLSGLGQTQAANLRLATAWQRGLLIFEETPLRQVVEEINRYRAGYVQLTNEAIANERVSGVFHIDNLDRALDTIQTQLHLSSTRLTNYVVLLQ